MDHALAVRDFTLAAGDPVPNAPVPMSLASVEFLVKMAMDELLELLATTHTPAEAKMLLFTIIADADERNKVPDDTAPTEVAAQQADAIVDGWYYGLNVAAKHGMNLSKVFELVHNANMAKRDPATHKFARREDGKITKPAGWTPPDVALEIARQIREGAFVPVDGAGETCERDYS